MQRICSYFGEITLNYSGALGLVSVPDVLTFHLNSMHAELEHLLDDNAKSLLEHHCKTIPRERLHLPGPDFIDRVYGQTDRPPAVLRSLAQIFNHGRVGNFTPATVKSSPAS